jgi:hypothetical protein
MDEAKHRNFQKRLLTRKRPLDNSNGYDNQKAVEHANAVWIRRTLGKDGLMRVDPISLRLISIRHPLHYNEAQAIPRLRCFAVQAFLTAYSLSQT